VGIGTFYHQFPDKSDLMRFLMDEEHQYRVRAFDTLAAKSAEEFSAQLTRVLGGSDPALLRAMIEACGVDERLRDFGREVRKETRERLATALALAREERDIRHPALDAGTAAWATLVMGDVPIDPTGRAAFEQAVSVLVFAEANGPGRARG
jgi:AcrR family transcriptional regulator